MSFNNAILDTPIEFLKGVGPQKAELLKKELNIFTYHDLLHHYPSRYIDTQRLNGIRDITPMNDYVQLKGIILNIREEGMGFKKRLVAELYDQTGSLELIWFQGGSFIKKQLEPNKTYIVFGKVSFFNGKPNITHPDIQLASEAQKNVTNAFQPIYPSTEKLKAKNLSNKAIGKLTAGLFEKIQKTDIPETLHPYIRQKHGLIDAPTALYNIHFPKDEETLEKAKYRLKWEELFYTQLKVAQLKVGMNKNRGYIFGQVGAYFNEFYTKHLPFELTGAQKRVIKEIREDVKHGRQMNRLVQGDVGSGKTMVAFLSMLFAIDNGFQACMMAPTEILARQHYKGLKALAKEIGLNVQLLTGSVKTKERRQILAGLADGTINILIGTHALLEDPVVFKNLGFAVIDEQHRFGVGQRAKLWKKNELPPHILVMTATPIPRTLAMTAYGDLDVSVIDEFPPGRKPIQTIHKNESFRPQVMQFIKEEIAKGRQIYIVYPLIEESEKLEYESLMAGFEQVKMWFPTDRYNIAMVHGKMEDHMKDANMQRFVSGDAHIMVATTVIEVGVNVPNASVMVIESAEKFGLSQLHQLRGRVGRGSEKSYCILLTSNEISKDARQRMSIMVQTNDGFLISEEDLKMRGPGDIYGTKQSGIMNFKIANIVDDIGIVEDTRNAALAIMSQDPLLQQPEHIGLRHHIKDHQNNVTAWNKIS